MELESTKPKENGYKISLLEIRLVSPGRTPEIIEIQRGPVCNLKFSWSHTLNNKMKQVKLVLIYFI